VVTFNGETFESPKFYTSLRQDEHAAAEIALGTLSRRGLSQSLTARIRDETRVCKNRDETGVCKNLLQKMAQRVGSTSRSSENEGSDEQEQDVIARILATKHIEKRRVCLLLIEKCRYFDQMQVKLELKIYISTSFRHTMN
jgi:hypothetical protein